MWVQRYTLFRDINKGFFIKKSQIFLYLTFNSLSVFILNTIPNRPLRIVSIHS